MASDKATFGQAATVSRFGRKPTTGQPTVSPANAPTLRRSVLPAAAPLDRAPLSSPLQPTEPTTDGLAPARPVASTPWSTTTETTAAPLPTGAPEPATFAIRGSEMQFVEIALGAGATAVAEAGGMMFKDAAVVMESKMSDGSAQSSAVMGKLLGAGKRLLTGESLFMTHFTNQGQNPATVAFAAPYPGKILPMQLSDHGRALNCQRDAFLCGIGDVSIGIAFQKKILAGLFGGGGFIMQRLEGDGLVFVHSGGSMAERQLAAGERIHVDAGCVVAYETTVSFDVARVGGIKSMLLGGEGLFFAELTGPGRVWMQSLPFSRLAARMLAGAIGVGGTGSRLGFAPSGGGGGRRHEDEAYDDDTPSHLHSDDSDFGDTTPTGGSLLSGVGKLLVGSDDS